MTVPLNDHQRRMIRALRDFLDGHPQFTRYERTLQNERGEVRVEYTRTVPLPDGRIHESTGAVQVYPTGEEEFCGREKGSRSVWKPSAVREVGESEL